MSLITVRFALFFVLFSVVYYLIPQKYQWWCILAANVLFLYAAGPISVVCILAVALITYLSALWIDRKTETYQKTKKSIDPSNPERKAIEKKLKANHQRNLFQCAAFGITGAVLIWLFSKSGKVSWFLPVAISYYTFIAVSYVQGVYQGKYKPERNFFKYLTFLSYFPQMTEGPFNRYELMREQLFASHTFRFENLSEGILRMLYGYVKKMVLADSLLILVNSLYGLQDTNNYAILALVILLPIQQYADFSGCMDIVIGMSKTFGITMQENFRSPIFSKSIDEVWRRWHITLGAFCKDYIFYPVALNKKLNKLGKNIARRHPKMGKMLPVLVSLGCVWTFMGIWHGFAWKYLIWGWMNLFFISTSLILEDTYRKWKQCLHLTDNTWFWNAFCILRTYLLFGIMEFVADGNSAGSALRGFRGLLFITSWSKECFQNFLDLFSGDFHPFVFMIEVLMILLVDIAKEKKIEIYQTFHQGPVFFKAALYVALFYLIILCAPNGIDVNAGFAYAVF